MSGVKGGRNKSASKRGRLIFVLGGASSGKSEVALRLAGAASPRAFVATGEPRDEEMAAKIARHQAERGQGWRTEEVPLDLTGWFEKQAGGFRAVLLDCLTLWMSNLLGSGRSEGEVLAMAGELLQAIRKRAVRVVVVSNELGLGLVPPDPAARRFRDLSGRVNRDFAAAADEVHVVWSGIATRIK